MVFMPVPWESDSSNTGFVARSGILVLPEELPLGVVQTFLSLGINDQDWQTVFMGRSLALKV